MSGPDPQIRAHSEYPCWAGTAPVEEFKTGIAAAPKASGACFASDEGNPAQRQSVTGRFPASKHKNVCAGLRYLRSRVFSKVLFPPMGCAAEYPPLSSATSFCVIRSAPRAGADMSARSSTQIRRSRLTHHGLEAWAGPGLRRGERNVENYVDRRDARGRNPRRRAGRIPRRGI